MSYSSKIDHVGMSLTPSLVHWKPWWLASLVVLACSLCITFNGDMVSLFEDDYFYYHVIARNYLDGHGMSFFPGVQTNGYQPLWQWVLIGSMALNDLIGADALRASHLVAVMVGHAAVALTCLRTARHAPLTLLILPTLLASAFYFSNMGMEAVAIMLVYPLYAMAIAKPGANWLLSAVLLFGCFLARIDSVVYIIPLTVYLHRRDGKTLARILVGFGVLAAMYAGINQVLYGSPVPISGMAKNASELRIHWVTFESLWRHDTHRLFIMMAALASLGTHFYKPALWRLQCLSWGCIAGFYVLHALRSDYGVWSWYLYPFALHMVTLAAFVRLESGQVAASPAVVARPFTDKRMLRGIQALGFVCLAVMVGWHTWQKLGVTEQNLLVRAGHFVKGVTHRTGAKVIAMGDRAGVVAHLSATPLVQLEGLVMDPAFLRSLSSDPESLTRILDRYNVDLYIASSPEPATTAGCYLVMEPGQATDRQTAQEICYPVVAVFEPEGGPRTVIFNVRLPSSRAHLGSAVGEAGEGNRPLKGKTAVLSASKPAT